MKNLLKTGGLLVGLALTATSCNKTLDELTLSRPTPPIHR